MDERMKQKKEMSPKKWGVWAISIFSLMIVFIALITYIVDPYFHYHEPLNGISYRLYEQRYINDGISRHFDYNAVITGNSLSENFKTSELDSLFDSKSIKLPYSGAGYNELWDSLDRTLSYNSSVEKVFVVVDTGDILRDKDYTRYTDYPEYLYDDIIWNDSMYLWNKDTFYRGTLYNLLMSIRGMESTTFDEYSAKEEETGADIVIPLMGEIPNSEDAVSWGYGEDDEQRVIDNINTNILGVTQKYPEITFYLLYPPPSIARWGQYYTWGDLNCRLESCKTATGLLLQQENIRLYSFQDDFELACDLDNYTDTIHYTPEIASYMLSMIADGQRELTLDNFEDYFIKITDFYTKFDYQTLRIEE